MSVPASSASMRCAIIGESRNSVPRPSSVSRPRSATRSSVFATCFVRAIYANLHADHPTKANACSPPYHVQDACHGGGRAAAVSAARCFGGRVGERTGEIERRFAAARAGGVVERCVQPAEVETQTPVELDRRVRDGGRFQ